MARRIGAEDDVGVLCLEHLTKAALREAFASWASDHAAASVLRAHSAWSSFFDFLVGEDLLEGSPMAAVGKPKRPADAPRAIRDPDAAARLLAAAATVDPRGRDPWPQRDLALVATFCVTGIREGEAVALGMASVAGEAGARRLEVVGKVSKARSIPIDTALEARPGRLSGHPGRPLSPPRPRSPRHCPLGRRPGPSPERRPDEVPDRTSLRQGRAPGPGSRPGPWSMPCATASPPRPCRPADVVELQTLLGHQSLDTTRRYLDASAAGLREVIKGHSGQIALREHLRGSAG